MNEDETFNKLRRPAYAQVKQELLRQVDPIHLKLNMLDAPEKMYIDEYLKTQYWDSDEFYTALKEEYDEILKTFTLKYKNRKNERG